MKNNELKQKFEVTGKTARDFIRWAAEKSVKAHDATPFKMGKTTFYWRRLLTCGESFSPFRIESRRINATVTQTANGFAVDLCEAWLPEATQGMEPDELEAVRLRAIMEAYGQKRRAEHGDIDWSVETDTTPTHSDPDGEAIASALASLRADM